MRLSRSMREARFFEDSGYRGMTFRGRSSSPDARPEWNHADRFYETFASAPISAYSAEPQSGETTVYTASIDDWRDGFISPHRLDGGNGFVLEGPHEDSYAGDSLAIAGDVNGDGFADVIVSAFGADLAYVVYGGPTSNDGYVSLNEINGVNGFRIQMPIGAGVAGVGDVNGDGLADVMVDTAGGSAVIFGSASGLRPQVDPATLDGSDGFNVIGGAIFNSAGDVNGDGIGDIILGNSGARYGGLAQAGRAYVIFGTTGGFAPSISLTALDGTDGFVIGGTTAGGYLGGSVAGAGDINGDGIGDIVIGARDNNGAGSGSAYVVFGRAAGFPAEFDTSTLDGSNGFRLSGLTSGNSAGISVDGAGDINGDGIADLIIGAPNADPGGRTDAGETYVVFGQSGGFSANIDLVSLDGSNGFVIEGEDGYGQVNSNDVMQRGDRLGGAVSAAGDLNGDGFDDIIVGATGYNYYDEYEGAEGTSYVVFGGDGLPARLAVADLDGTNGFRIGSYFQATGYSLSGGADVNGDGYDDVIAGDFAYDAYFEGGAFVIYGHSSGQTEGTAGDDELHGAGGRDTLRGYEGNDYLFGGYLQDLLIGGTGDDYYDGVTLLDTITELAGEGIDTIRTRIDNLTLGENIENLALIGSGAVTGNGNALNNTLTGSERANVLNGFSGNDTLDGQRGSDVLNGGTGRDVLLGNLDNDTLHGDRNGDRLLGGAGRDIMSGGADADLFVFRTGDFAALGAATSDRILDFSQAEEDRINLSHVDADPALAGNQAFIFIGAAEFSNTAGELRYLQRDGFTMIQGDTNGDGRVDFAVRLDGLIDLTAGDFVL